MSNLRDIINSNDTATEQLVVFYELAKLGVIRFNMGNPAHAKILESFANEIAGYSVEKHKDEPLHFRMEKNNRYVLYCLIFKQLMVHAVTGFQDSENPQAGESGKKKWVCYRREMELGEGDRIIGRFEDGGVFTARVVCDGIPEVILDFEVGLDLDVFFHKRDILMVLR